MERISNSLDKLTEPAKEKLPEFLLCPITRALMYEPVLVSTGVTYEKVSIEHYIEIMTTEFHMIKEEDPDSEETLERFLKCPVT